MSDLIDRGAVRDILDIERNNCIAPDKRDEYERGWYDAYECVAACIDRVPTANQWIPVSERLPEKFIDVLTCWGIDGTLDVAYLDANKSWTSAGFGSDLPVKAWMPLPEPYWEDEDE